MLYAVVAMQKEADTLLAQAHIERKRTLYGKRVFEGTAFGKQFGLVLCGVGKTNAAAGTMLALTLGADRLLNFGVAGGVSPQARVGTLWQIDRAVQFDFDLHTINGTPVGTLNEYQTPYFPLSCRENAFPKATLASGDRFTDGRAEAALSRPGRRYTRWRERPSRTSRTRRGYPAPFKLSDGMGDDTRVYTEKLQDALAALQDNMQAIFEEALHG